MHEQRTLMPGSGGARDASRRRTTRRRSGFGLPPELLEQARGRLRYLALLLSIVLAAVVLYVLFQGDRPEYSAASQNVILALYVVCLLMSLALYGLARWAPWSHGTVLGIGLVYEVLQCLLISLGVQWRIWVETGTLPHVTWSSCIIILYPLVVPSPPRTTAGTAVTAAATAPLSIAILQGVGYLPFEPVMYLDSSISPVASVVLAVFGSQVVYGLSRDVARARELGSYRLETPLGEGGMGTVWRASHRMLARPAAVKMISPQALGTQEDPEVLARRFRREAEATAVLCSAHTINLFDFGVAEDGMLYYVMEYLEGFDMEHLVETYGPLPAGRAVHLLGQTCHSLAEAHDNGLIHRDVKPANLYVCHYGREFDHVKVLDFGLVKAQDDGLLSDVDITIHDLAGGTPAYMAPEQILGNRELDGRTDIYSLGCVAYWLLTGQLLFDASTPMEMMVEHTRSEPLPPSRRTELAVPEDLESLVMLCLAKEPEDRPAGVEVLVEELRSLAERHPWERSEAVAWWRMHRPREGRDAASGSSGESSGHRRMKETPAFRKQA